MIVYSKNKRRLTNFKKINTLLNNSINKFEAIDTINNFDYWKQYALDKKYTNINMYIYCLFNINFENILIFLMILFNFKY